MICGECNSKNYEKTGRQRHHSYEFECQDCGHTWYWG